MSSYEEAVSTKRKKDTESSKLNLNHIEIIWLLLFVEFF